MDYTNDIAENAKELSTFRLMELLENEDELQSEAAEIYRNELETRTDLDWHNFGVKHFRAEEKRERNLKKTLTSLDLWLFIVLPMLIIRFFSNLFWGLPEILGATVGASFMITALSIVMIHILRFFFKTLSRITTKILGILLGFTIYYLLWFLL